MQGRIQKVELEGAKSWVLETSPNRFQQRTPAGCLGDCILIFKAR